MSGQFGSQQQNLFLTATNSPNKNIYRNQKHKLSFNINAKSQSCQNQQIKLVKSSILEIIKQLQRNQSFSQVKQLLYETFYLITQSHHNKNIQKIKQVIQHQTSLIKLKRLLNQLRIINKNISKRKSPNNSALKLIQHTPFQQQPKTKLFKLSKTTKKLQKQTLKTLPNQDKQQIQYKNCIKQQISYRERLQKIKSQNQKHIKKRSQFINKKVQKLKELNKKVYEVYKKNKVVEREKNNKYKYEVLFDPDNVEINRMKRGKTMEIKSRNHSFQLLQQRFTSKGEIKFKNPFQISYDQYNTSSNNKSKKLFLDQQNNKLYTKNDIITFKSLKDLYGQNIKRNGLLKKQFNKHPNNLYKKNIQSKNSPHKNSPTHSKQNKQTPQTNLSYSFKYNIKHKHVLQKKQSIQQQKYHKIINQVINKNNKITNAINKKKSSVNNLKSFSSNKNSLKNSRTKSHSNLDKSKENSRQKSMFKKVYITRKELLDKEKKIFVEIENKIENKEMFLQNRVNKIRQRLNKQQQIRQKHKNNYKKYINFTQNASLYQTMTASPKNQSELDLNNTNQKSHLFKKIQNNQQKVIKLFHEQKLKKQANLKIKQKLTNFSLNQLHTKLKEIQTQEQRKNKENQNLWKFN